MPELILIWGLVVWVIWMGRGKSEALALLFFVVCVLELLCIPD